VSVEAVKRLIEHLDSKIVDDNPGQAFFSDEQYTSFPLSPENFRDISTKTSNHALIFVDGGNQEILGAPNFSIQLNRVYFNVFKSNKRVKEIGIPCRVEFFSATYSIFRDNEIFYDTSIFPVRPEYSDFVPSESDLSFRSTDRTVTVGTLRADIERVASIARRFAEWELACHVVPNLERGDVIVMDGTLQTNFTNESKYLRKLAKTAYDRGVILTGLSKTSALFTDTGLSLIGAVRKIAEDNNLSGRWFIPVAIAATNDHNAMIMIAKLHPMAERIFRYEISGDQYNNLGEEEVVRLFADLTANACDISFAGYPYGLIDADRFARVTNNEIEHYQAVLLSEMSKLGKWRKFARHMKAVDAHQLLNLVMK